MTLAVLHPPCLGDSQNRLYPSAFALRSFLTYLSATRHPGQLLLKVAEQNNDLFMVNMIHGSHPWYGNMQQMAYGIMLCMPVPLSLHNSGAAELFILLGTKGHKHVKSETSTLKSREVI